MLACVAPSNVDEAVTEAVTGISDSNCDGVRMCIGGATVSGTGRGGDDVERCIMAVVGIKPLTSLDMGVERPPAAALRAAGREAASNEPSLYGSIGTLLTSPTWGSWSIFGVECRDDLLARGIQAFPVQRWFVK